MDTNAGITKEFLESALKAPISRFLVNKGSSLGDGYMALLHSVDVWKVGQDEPLHILIKCFPSNPARQQFFQQHNIFQVEVGMYDVVIPALKRFLKEKNADDIQLPFAPFYAGQTKSSGEENSGPTDPLDNFLIMTDLRKTSGFSMTDRFKGLDLDHFKLVLEGQATLHAVSWAYKHHTGQSLLETFPCLYVKQLSANSNTKTDMNDFMVVAMNNIKELFQDIPRLQEGIDHIQTIVKPMFKLYKDLPLSADEKHHTKDSVLKKPGVAIPNEEPWQVLLHGDCWSNNLLFRYDQVTGRPVEVVFIDLQVCHEGDPMADVNYSLYANTNTDLRQKHLSSLLKLYFDTFERICNRLAVPALPGWSWEEFSRRFHRAQIYGIYVAVSLLPRILQNPEEVKDMESVEMPTDGATAENMKKLVTEMTKVKYNNPVMLQRLRAVLEDGVSFGII